MKQNLAVMLLTIGIILLVVGFVMVNLANVTTMKSSNSPVRSTAWNITGSFLANDVLELIVKANSNWTELMAGAGDEWTTSPISVGIQAPSGQILSLAVTYYVYPADTTGSSTGSTPDIEVDNYTIVLNEADQFLELENVTQRITCKVKVSGNYTAIVDKDSVVSAIGPIERPPYLTLYSSSPTYSNRYLFAPAVGMVATGPVLLIAGAYGSRARRKSRVRLSQKKNAGKIG